METITSSPNLALTIFSIEAFDKASWAINAALRARHAQPKKDQTFTENSLVARFVGTTFHMQFSSQSRNVPESDGFGPIGSFSYRMVVPRRLHVTKQRIHGAALPLMRVNVE